MKNELDDPNASKFKAVWSERTLNLFSDEKCSTQRILTPSVVSQNKVFMRKRS